jgi:hypothetical protein
MPSYRALTAALVASLIFASGTLFAKNNTESVRLKTHRILSDKAASMELRAHSPSKGGKRGAAHDVAPLADGESFRTGVKLPRKGVHEVQVLIAPNITIGQAEGTLLDLGFTLVRFVELPGAVGYGVEVLASATETTALWERRRSLSYANYGVQRSPLVSTRRILDEGELSREINIGPTLLSFTINQDNSLWKFGGANELEDDWLPSVARDQSREIVVHAGQGGTAVFYFATVNRVDQSVEKRGGMK